MKFQLFLGIKLDGCMLLGKFWWSTGAPPGHVPPPEIAGLIKGLLTIGFP